MNQPLCGWDWFRQHRNDYTQAYVDSLSIELRVCGKLQAQVQAGEKKDRGIVREIVRINR